jgi:hypothetical protein
MDERGDLHQARMGCLTLLAGVVSVYFICDMVIHLWGVSMNTVVTEP